MLRESTPGRPLQDERIEGVRANPSNSDVLDQCATLAQLRIVVQRATNKPAAMRQEPPSRLSAPNLSRIQEGRREAGRKATGRRLPRVAWPDRSRGPVGAETGRQWHADAQCSR